MMRNTYRCIVAVKSLLITGNQIEEIKNAQIIPDHLWRHLPEYCVRRDNGQLQKAYEHLPFVTEGEEPYCLFDIDYAEDPLNDQAAEGGWEDLDLDFSILPTLPNINTYNGVAKPSLSDILLIDLTYESSYDHYSGATEYDAFAEIVGHLDNDRNPILIEELCHSTK